MQAACDEEILSRADQEDRIVISADSDFSAILAARERARPSFILFREPNMLSAQDYLDALLPVLPMLEQDMTSGCVAVFRRSRLRVRRLPFSE
jgi:predicted nuclease of predicted toxin-antitoxin system